MCACARVPVCTQQAVCPADCALRAAFSPGNAVFTGPPARGEVGFGGPGGDRGVACSPEAEASVGAGLLLSPGSPHRLSPHGQAEVWADGAHPCYWAGGTGVPAGVPALSPGSPSQQVLRMLGEPAGWGPGEGEVRVPGPAWHLRASPPSPGERPHLIQGGRTARMGASRRGE